MLHILNDPKQIDYGQIMQVYHQSLQESGSDRYPWLDDYEQLLEAEQDFYLFLNSFLRGKDSIVAVWTANDKYVSALRIEPYRDGLLISGLETAIDFRRRSFAKELLRAVLGYLKEWNYKKIYSHIHKGNVPSIRTHESCGFVFSSDYAVYVDGSVDHQCHTYVKEIP